MTARIRHTRTAPIIAGAVLAVAGLVGGSMANADAHAGRSPGTPAHVTTRGDSIPNVTLVEDAITAYYGSTTVAAPAALTSSLGLTTLTEPSPTGAYAKEMKGIESRLQNQLSHWHAGKSEKGKPAVVFDIDDTTLNTYNYEVYSQFGYVPATNADFVDAEAFPANPGMTSLVNWVNTHGYTVFFITGRPETQRGATVGNLQKVGYTEAMGPDRLFLKNKTNPPAYLTCGSTCTTIQYKSGTRKYIESEGYNIVASVGDQYSDLEGGYDDLQIKLPNPMYYLP